MIRFLVFKRIRRSAQKYRPQFCTSWLGCSKMHCRRSKQFSCCYL